jgi:2-polyprenyl-3-methyl-5-hydroxy-6-metoxy-1,4-benzoquinol methylase
MISSFEVELCYRYILGREPESESVVRNLAKAFDTVGDLRRAMLCSNEMRPQLESFTAVSLRPLSLPPNSVEVAVSPEYLQRMMWRVEQSWQDLGKSEPFWSVLTHNSFLSSNIEENKAAFYETGKLGAELFFAAAARAGITDFSGRPVCIEYGCGVGRLTVWLAQHFKEIIACDISQPHLDYARLECQRRDIYNVDLIRIATVDAINELPRFDVFFSIIVLQHNPPPVAAYILEKVLQKLNPNGLAYFQIPTYQQGYAFNAHQYIEAKDRLGMEMHVVPQKDLFELFARCGCSVLEVREDEWTGDQRFVSNSFLLCK